MPLNTSLLVRRVRSMKVKVVMSPYEDNEVECTVYTVISARMPLNTSFLVRRDNEGQGCDVSI